jgi:microcystin-dependent protein
MRAIRRAEQTGSNSVGTKVESFLTEAQFLELNGNTWTLCDGKSVSGSRYHAITGLTVVPNHVGLVSRMTGTQSINSRSKVGPALKSSQEDQLQGHYHSASASTSIPFGHTANPDNTKLASSSHTAGAFGSATTTVAVTGATTGANGTPRTGDETRISSIGVNVFIKIN